MTFAISTSTASVKAVVLLLYRFVTRTEEGSGGKEGRERWREGGGAGKKRRKRTKNDGEAEKNKRWVGGEAGRRRREGKEK